MWVCLKRPPLKSLPFNMAKGISVLLPTWEDTVGWSSRNPKVLACLKTGYPRFFIPRIVNDLATQMLERGPLAVPVERNIAKNCSVLSACNARLALLFPCYRFAKQCQEFLLLVGMAEPAQVHICSVGMTDRHVSMGIPGPGRDYQPQELYAVAYPENLFPQAKSFWQHTGHGVSSRYATYWLENAQFLQQSLSRPTSPRSRLPIEEADDAKVILRRRIAALSSTDTVRVSPEDVYLYPTGMSSVCSTADVLQKLDINRSPVCKVAVFG